ncbi:hypothetical protein JXD38_10570 [candidate division WOR-3 bacterium]|nr:hypothetical protein [candidate division WOR-3 bacterium]
MSPLLAEMDRVIAGIARLDRRSAFAALEAVFGGLKARYEVLSEAEVSEFVELTHLILLQFARGATIRVSGPRQPHGLDVCLKYNDVYEAALHRTMEFLSRHLHDHIEKYSPRQYLRASLRVLGKEYHNVLSDSYRTESIPEESAALKEDEAGSTTTPGPEELTGRQIGVCTEEALLAAAPDGGYARACPDESAGGREQQMFYNWYEGNLSRCEVARLYGMTMECVDRTLLKVARTYEDGRHYGMIKWLVEMGEDGDIIWLLSKDMTAADVGQKIHRNQWVVYKHRDAVRRRLGALGLTGDEGRAFLARLFGLPAGAECTRQLGRGRTAKAALVRPATQAAPG